MTTTLNFFLSPGRSGTQWIGDLDHQATARRYERSPVRRVARNIVRGLLGRYYNPIRRRMVERRQARNSPGSAR
jgi:hypothetical protein